MNLGLPLYGSLDVFDINFSMPAFPTRAFFARSVSILAATAACLLLTGCVSDGLRAYKKGKYYQACEQAVKKLSGKPDNANAHTALAGAYPLAQAGTQRQIDSLGDASSLDSYENVIAICDRMNKIANAILHCPPALALVPNPTDYTGPRNAAAAVLVRRAYRAGVRASADGTLAKSREALGYFERVIRYSPNYRRVQVRIAQARYDATMRVVVTRPRVSCYLPSTDYFYTWLLIDLPYRNLLRFYTPEEAVREGMANPHRIVELDFLDYADGNVRKTVNTSNLVRSVAIGTTTAEDGSKQTVYGDVKAEYTTTRLEMQSTGRIWMCIIDTESGRVTYDHEYSDSYTWTSETATFNGDERALDSKQLALTKKRPQAPPSAQSMYEKLADLLRDKIAFDISWYVDR